MIGRTRWRFQSVGSTQDTAFALAKSGAEHGTIVRADYQSAGRGRQGRSWQAPPGTALMFSVILRPGFPIDEVGTLPIRIARSLIDVCDTFGAKDISLKWPNDVLIRGEKVSGILVQTRSLPELVVVAGIGINISASPPGATNLVEACGIQVSADNALDRIVTSLNHMWNDWQPSLSPRSIAEIDDLLWLNGQEVTLQDAERTLSGRILGVSSDGGLRLEQDGIERTLYVGEITRGPRQLIPDHRA